MRCLIFGVVGLVAGYLMASPPHASTMDTSTVSVVSARMEFKDGGWVEVSNLYGNDLLDVRMTTTKPRGILGGRLDPHNVRIPWLNDADNQRVGGFVDHAKRYVMHTRGIQ